MSQFPPISQHISTYSVGLLLFASAIYYTLYYTFPQALRSSGAKTLPYPPGPPPKDWLSGHARYFFSPKLWLLYTSWGDKYGHIVHLKAFGKHTLVLNSMEDAVELLEKRSNNYSDRPYIPMINLIGWTFTTAFKSYGDDWHKHRRLLQQTFRPSASLEYRPKQAEKVVHFLHDLLEDPDKYIVHIRKLTAAIVMSTVYGYDIKSTEDRFVVLAEDALAALSQSSFPGAAIVNVLPFLRFLPSWFPGAGFKRYAASVVQLINEMEQVPYEFVQKTIAAGTASPSLVSSLLDSCNSEDDHRILKEVAATGYAAGADTSSSSLGTFFYAMTAFRDVQRKAQQEIDSIVGNDRLISYEDQDSLPYLQALCREVLRFRPVLPLCVFHAASADDVYQGYFIPKGTTVVANVWAFTRDPKIYKDPEQFNPDRYFDENGKLNNDDVTYVFGFGRRICPGRHAAFATVWLAIARVLSTFDIKPAKDAQGNDIPPSGEYTDGLLIHPLPFKCSITPRSKQAKKLIIDSRNGI